MASPREAAEMIISELGFSAPGEINVEVVAEFLGVEVRERAIDGSAATIVGVGGRGIINVDPNTSGARRRFSIAHELGHWIYDRDKVADGCTADAIEGGGGKSLAERRADKFASELLMPFSMMREWVCSRPSIARAKELANSFEVSLTAATIRLVELAEHPALLVCTRFDRRRLWYNRGPALPEDLRPHREIEAAALRATLPQEPGQEADGIVSADVWIDDEQADQFELHEGCITISAQQALSLLTWPDEAQIVEWIGRE